jgi:hypothetical protein
MNFMLIHDGSDSKTAKFLLTSLKKMKTGVDECIFGESEEGIELFLENIPHTICLILCFAQPGVPAWVHFVAGYARAIKLPVLVYGSAPADFGSLLSKSLIVVKNGKELSGYIGKEMPGMLTREVRDRARYEILSRGIPFSEEALTDCVVGGNGAAVALFIEAGFSPNIQDRFGVPLMNLAARMGNRKMVKILLNAGARIDQQAGDRQSSALLDAVAGSHHGILKDLLAVGADVNLKSRDGQSALVIAVGLNDEVSAEMLLRAGADADEPDSLGASARKYAALFNKPAMMALLNVYGPKKVKS